VSTVSEVRAGRREDDGTFTELNGGTLFHLFSIPPHTCQVQIPAEANVIARRVPIPLFGAGLVEAIPDEVILALEDPEDRNEDGIRGRAARVTDIVSGNERIGRFGWKSQHATLLAFSGDAYRNEMGITNDLFPQEMANGVEPERLRVCSPKRGVEDIRDRRTRMRGIDNFTNFMKFLAPVPRGSGFPGSSVTAGEGVFRSLGCTSCHVPVLTTGWNANPLFDRKPVPLYSDLLLHDVGTGDGILQAAAGADELRTPALWGLRFRRPLLHDGSAATIRDAVLRHAGEANRTIENYKTLSESALEQLLDFLNSL
jgi:CxxC motif-containing protein (DUF1111 family)